MLLEPRPAPESSPALGIRKGQLIPMPANYTVWPEVMENTTACDEHQPRLAIATH
jgi:hypothetical protein